MSPPCHFNSIPYQKNPAFRDLATLLERVGLLFKIFECEIQTFILLWCNKAVKLDYESIMSSHKIMVCISN